MSWNENPARKVIIGMEEILIVGSVCCLKDETMEDMTWPYLYAWNHLSAGNDGRQFSIGEPTARRK